MKLKTNNNLTLSRAQSYDGMQLLRGNGYLVEGYLQRIKQTIELALHHHTRVCAIRFDIRLPSHLKAYPDHFTRNFIKSLRAKVHADQHRKASHATRAYSCHVDYLWTLESSEKMGGSHYHFAIFLNKDAYHSLGDMRRNSGNMYARIVQALASSLHISFEEAQRGIHIPDNPIYYLDGNSAALFAQKEALFTRLSYFAKHRTKSYNNHIRHFSYSR